MKKVSSEQPHDFRWRAAVLPAVGNAQQEKQKALKGTFTDFSPAWSITGEATDVAVTALALESV